MKDWVLALLIVAGVFAAVIVVVAVIYICIECWLSGDEQADEENPPCLDQSRGGRASQRRDSWVVFFLLLSPIFVG